ncbi:MAG: octaprenyl-diphosphate synthase [Bacteriovoracaceae bacterium]
MLETFLQEIPAQALGKAQDINLDIPYEKCNEEINHLLGKTVLLGGKRLRPLLTYLMGRFFGVDDEKLDACAQSIEMVHAASLAHDDVVDNASTRRGRDSINAASSNKHAVLAGDYLLASVIMNLCKQDMPILVSEMSRVIMDLAEGEWIQLEAIDKKNYSVELIRNIALKKTASVMSWCAVSPAILSHQSEEVISLARDFGVHLGLGFQLMDDTLDFGGASQKDANLDLENGVISAVYFEWLQNNPSKFEAFKNGESFKDVFTGEGIDQAIASIKSQAHANLDRADEILHELARKVKTEKSFEELEKDLKPLSFILRFIGRRDF